MSLELEISKIFEAGLKKVIAREKADEDYLSHEFFKYFDKPNRERAKAILAEALKLGAEDFLTLAVANHREEEHKEDHGEEVAESRDALVKLQINPAEAVKGWWHH